MLNITIHRLPIKAAASVILAALTTLAALGAIVPHTASAAQPAWYEDGIAFADMPVANNDQGLIQTDNLEIFGPGQQTSFGDPYTPVWDGASVSSYYPELKGAYTYRIAIPPGYPYSHVRVELLDPQTGNTSTLPTRIYQTTGASTTSGITCSAQTEPCLISTTMGSLTDPYNPFWFARMDEYRDKNGNPPYNRTNNTRTLFRLYYQRRLSNGVMQPVDLAYYIGKKDDPSQNRLSQGSWTSAQTAAQSQTEAVSTMLQWVSPGVPAAERMPPFFATGGAVPAPLNNGVTVLYNTLAEPATVTESCAAIDSANGAGQALRMPMLSANPQPGGVTPVAPANTPCAGDGDFVVDLTSEASDIYTDPLTGIRYLSLDVIGVDGASENNFAVWAGPARADFTPNSNGYTIVDAPADVNARQLYVYREKNAAGPASPRIVHSSTGVSVYGTGHLPLNILTSNRVRIPLAYLGPEYAGKNVSIQLFDADGGTLPPIIFYINGIPQDTWQACFTSGAFDCSTDQGGGPGGSLGPDNLLSNDTWVTYNFTLPSASAPTSFNGGMLMVYYMGAVTDTFQFKISTTTPLPGTLLLDSPADGAIVGGTPAYSWQALSGASIYQYEYDDAPDFGSPIWISDITDQLNVTPPDQAQGTYYWRARARGPFDAWGAWSTPRSITVGQPAAPTGLTATPNGQTEIDLGWTDNASGAAQFKVERSPAGLGTWTLIQTTAAGATSYPDAGLPCGTAYDYRVTATNGIDSDPSNVATASTDTCAPIASLSAASHSFGGVHVGSPAGPVTFTLNNTGQAALNPGTLTKIGAADFALSADSCTGASVAPGGSCSFDISFTPAAPGAASGSVSIPDDAAGSPHSVSFDGAGTLQALSLSAASHNFGDQFIGVASAPFTVTVSNPGSDPLTITGITPSGDFAVANNTCTAPVAAGGSCTFDVTFTPTLAGARTGSISIASDAPTSPDSVSLSGNGVPAGPPPALGSPINGAGVYSHTPKLTWASQPGVLGYHILVRNLTTLAVVADQDVSTPYFVTPTIDFGSYSWQVKSHYPSGWGVYSLLRTFDMTIIKTPGRDAAVGTHFPTLAWQAVGGATLYHFEIYTSGADCRNGVTANAVFQKDTAKTTYRLIPPDPSLAFGAYYWRIAATQGTITPFMPCWPFSITTLKTPKPESFLASLLPKFSWLGNKAAKGYQINVYRVAPDGSSSLFFSRTTKSPGYRSVAADGFTYGHYKWTIQENIGGTLGSETPAFAFDLTIQTKPIAKTFSLDDTPTFSWKKITGQTSYTLQIADDMAFTNILHSYDAGNVTTFTIPDADALPQGVYYWRIVAAPGGFTMPGWSITIGP